MAADKNSKKKIFLVEDDEKTIEILVFALEREGFSVTVARDGKEALSLLGRDFDLIILDLVLPRLNGFEVLRILRGEKMVKTPVLVLSNLSREEDVEKTMLLGANDYLVKSALSIGAILQKVKGALKNSR